MARARSGFKKAPIIKAFTIVAAALLALFQLPSSWIERFYSNGIYPLIQPPLAFVSNSVPFAIMDVLIFAAFVGLVGWWWIRIAKAGRGARLRAALAMAINTAVFGSALFLVFLLAWGFNYGRLPLTSRLDYDEHRISRDALARQTVSAITELNRLGIKLHAEPAPSDDDWMKKLLPSLNAVIADFGRRRGIGVSKPKRSLLDAYIAATGTPAFIDPFASEVIVDSRLLAIEKPGIIAHEWAHIAGYADESEAGYVGLLACMRSISPFVRYSGLLNLYPYLRSAAAPWTQEEIEKIPRFAPEVIEDFKSISSRQNERYHPRISSVQWKIYDKFLKANHIKEGTENYGLLLNLLLGIRYEQEWVPAVDRPE